MGLLEGARLVALDTETTGFDLASGHALVEVARVDIEYGRLGASWSSLVNPGRPIPRGATQVHGITDEMVAGAPRPAEVAGPLRDAVGERTLVFHNAAFDLGFLSELLRAGGHPPLLNPVVDTVGLARGLLDLPGYSLAALAESLGLPVETRHRALGDARTTARLFLALAARWERERGVGSVAELAAASQDVLRIANSLRARVVDWVDLAMPTPGAISRPAEGAAVSPIIAPVTGQAAPDFQLRGPGGQLVTLSEYRGHKHVVLVFFPLAFSPACSNQLPEIQRHLPRFEALDAVVLGVSVDSHYANEAFARRLGVSFPLLSDFQREASRDYGVLLPEKGYSARTTFLIDKQGRLALREDSPDGSRFPSNERILEALERLGPA